MRVRSKNPATDEPIETGRELRDLTIESGARNFVLNLSGVTTSSTPFNCALHMFSASVGSIDGRLALCNVDPLLMELFQLCKFPVADRRRSLT